MTSDHHNVTVTHTGTPLLGPQARAFLAVYRTWPAWRRWLWRKGWIA